MENSTYTDIFNYALENMSIIYNMGFTEILKRAYYSTYTKTLFKSAEVTSEIMLFLSSLFSAVFLVTPARDTKKAAYCYGTNIVSGSVKLGLRGRRLSLARRTLERMRFGKAYLRPPVLTTWE